MEKTTRKERASLTRAVLIGLTAGATAFPFGVASAATTSTTSDTSSSGATIAADDTTDFQSVTLNSSSNYSKISSTGSNGVEVRLTDGMTDHGTTLFATDDGANEGGWIGVGFGTDIANNYVPSSTASADMRNTTFHAENGADIELVNGTVITTADQLFGTADDTYGGYGTSTANPGQISIDLDVEGANDTDKIAYANINAKATLKLVDDKTFNDPSSWTYKDSSGTEQKATATNFIKLTDHGVLETDAAQLFGDGITANKTTASDTWTNANNAINFAAGTVLFDDTDLTLTELDAAQNLISNADSGTTIVATKTDTSSMSHAIADVPESGAFVKATASSATGVTIASGNTSANSSVAKFNASSLELKKTDDDTTANTVAITGSTVQLGARDGKLLTVTDGTNTGLTPATDAAITVTNGGALNLVGDSTNTLAADVTLGTNTTSTTTDITDGSSFTVTGGTKTVGDITAYEGTSVTVNDGASLTAGTVTANDDTTVTLGRNTNIAVDEIKLSSNTSTDTTVEGTTLNVLGTLSGQKITTDGGSNTINVGADDAQGILIVKKDTDDVSNSSTLKGATIFLDPAWETNSNGTSDISKSSKFATDGTTADQAASSDVTVNYTLTVGRNSVASLGTTDTTVAEEMFANSKQTWGYSTGETTAALLLEQPVTLVDNSGGVKVDGSLTSSSTTTNAASDTATFGANSLLMVDLWDYTPVTSTTTGTTALKAEDTTNSTLTVDSTAKLYLENNAGGTQTYQITSGFNTTSGASGWYTDTDNIVVNRLFEVTKTENGAVTITNQDVRDVLPGVVLVNNINGLTADTNTTISKKSSNAGLRYIANAVKNANSDARATYLLNVAAQPAEVAGASATALENTQLLAQSVQDHFSTLNSLERDKDNDIWARYTHNYTKNDGLALDGLEADYDSNLNAITIGYDFEPTKNYRHGIAFSYGTGSTNATDESDDYNIFGASYYGNIPSTRKNAPSALFDVGYYTTSHDIDGLIDVNPDTHAFTLGATAEWTIDKAKGFSIVPHVGLRYTYLDTPGYDGTYDGGTAFRYSPSSASVLTLPVGVGLTSDHVQNGWRYRFSADLSYIPTLSGRDTDMDVQTNGYSFTDNISYDLADANQVLLRLGYSGETQTQGWNIGASYHTGGDTDGADITAQYHWKF